MPPSYRSISRIALLVLFVCAGTSLWSQTDSILRAPRLPQNVSNDPVRLVAALTDGKDSDLEKFDAIFSWVAVNIKYDYNQYFSGKGSTAITDVEHVLKSKRAICGQYSDMMNHLCSLAGIRSVTITGYTKGRLFDIKDTLFFEDHSWNAVELDGKWNLYDVTWSAGGYVRRLTHASQTILNWRERIFLNKVRDLKRKVVVKFEKNEICEIPKHREKKTYTVPGLPLFWRIVDHILALFPQRYTIDNGEVLQRQYYLTDPGLFASTHFPTIPFWSLTPDMNSLSEFANDAGYYDFEPTQLLTQNREGTLCPKCDELFELSPIEQEKLKIAYALENNPRNGLAPSRYGFYMADLYYEQAKQAIDSAEKAQYYDSTLQILDFSATELSHSRRQLTAYHKFHFKKEKSKLTLVQKNNQAHTENNIRNVKQMRGRASRIRRLQNRIASCQRTSLRFAQTYERMDVGSSDAIPMKEQAVEVQLRKADKIEAKIDSLNELINELEPLLIDHANRISDQVWQQNNLLRPQAAFFHQTAYLRIIESLDDRHKRVNLIQDSIFSLEELVRISVMNDVLLPTDTLLSDFKELMKLIRFRDNEQLKALKVYAKLYEGQYFSLDEFNSHRARFVDSSKQTYCYFYEHRLPLAYLIVSFKEFRDNHYLLYKCIKKDSGAERIRYRDFLDEVLLNKHRVKHVIENNLKYVVGYKRDVKADRKKWQKQLRKERRKSKD